MRRLLRILAVLGIAAAVAAIVRRLLAERGDAAPSVAPWDELTGNDVVQPAPVVPVSNNGSDASAEPTSGPGDDEDADWVLPDDGGSCPSGFPVKAKLSSNIFHVPGGGSYERTRPDRCYLNEAAAEADGLRQAKR